jgi:hypothetical protein
MTTSTLTLLDRAANFLESIQQRLNIEFDQHHQIVKKIKQDTRARALLKRALSGDPKHLRDTYFILEYLYRVDISYNPENEYGKGEFWLLVTYLFPIILNPLVENANTILDIVVGYYSKKFVDPALMQKESNGAFMLY